MSSGNLGDEDGTDVEEFDSALNNRLIHINHTLDVQEWLGDYAEENCHPMITSYIKTHPEQMYKKSDDCKG
jgi:acyl carrier protein phosphodiesterase